MLMALTVAVAAQLFGSSAWTPLTSDTISVERLSIQYGITGNRPTDCIASTGECRFTLRNDAGNSGGTQGWYSPLHASARSGWTFEIPVRVTFQYQSPVSVSSITRSGNTATVTAASHGLSTGEYVEITGATPDHFNGVFRVTVSSANTFTYTLGGIGNWALSHAVSSPRVSDVRVGKVHRSTRTASTHTGGAMFVSAPRRRLARGFTARRPVALVPRSPATGTITATRTFIKFLGTIDTIDPEPGENGSQRVHVTAYDGMRDILDVDIRDIPLQVNVTESDVIGTVLDAMPASAIAFGRDLDTGLDQMPYVLDDVGRVSRAGTIIADLARSTYGLFFCKGDGTRRYVSRNTRATTASSYHFTNMRDIRVPSSLSNVYNDIWTTVHPRTVDAALVVLYAVTGTPPVVPGNSQIVISAPFRDPNDSTRLIGGTGIEQPSASTDYAANSSQDGSGTDLTSSVTVSASVAASRVTFTVRNTSNTPVFLVNGSGEAFLRVRGRGVYDNGSYDLNAPSGRANRPLRLDLPYQNDATVALQIAEFINGQYSNLAGQVDSLTIIANVSDAFTEQALAREPGDVVTATEQMTGVSGVDSTILSCAYDFSLDILTTTWGLGPVVTIEPPNDPSVLSATITSDETLDLSWTPGQTGAYTQIFQDGMHIGTAGIGASSYSVNLLSPATNYEFEVRHLYFGLLSGFATPVTARPIVSASGGTETTPGDGYKYHTFTSSGTFTITVPGHIDILTVGGGGGGGGAADWSGSGGGESGGGGGGGGRVKALFNELEPAGAHAIVIGAGGAGSTGAGADGNDTTYRGTVLVSNGGGLGAFASNSPNGGGNGGCGGGGAGTGGGTRGSADAVDTGVDIDLGFNGGNGANNPGGAIGGGGGGGAGGAGSNATSVGGAGGPRSAEMFDGNTYAAGGVGGRGTSPAAGAANTGDGGGGGQIGTASGSGFNGGSGKVVIRYPL